MKIIGGYRAVITNIEKKTLPGRHATAGIQWELIFDLLALIEEWMGERGKETTPSERNDLLRTLYAQFCTDSRIDVEQMRATFRLVK